MAPPNFKLNPDRPIGEQLVAECERLIAVGEWKPGERVPSVRALAVQFGVNPNTVQKALALLDERSLLVARSTSGRFVTEDEALIARTGDRIARSHAAQYARAMRALKIGRERAIELFDEQAKAIRGTRERA
ncbi:MAG: GntR family transcriptional regulator [Actinomycetaceae bacterium]|nr:GntR family transcriptional regulator [Arcanobacterium sp.]MDD7505305.1 GntR family transcriptional regulator [Actinomycetaceae bacterium]MDY6143531.1 GntR family transcriptional regulator [Arcanobacterium sp.]